MKAASSHPGPRPHGFGVTWRLKIPTLRSRKEASQLEGKISTIAAMMEQLLCAQLSIYLIGVISFELLAVF